MHIEVRLNPEGYLEYRVSGGFNLQSQKWKPSRDMAPIDKLVAETGMEVITRDYEDSKSTYGQKNRKKPRR